jgi:hypothetical protein
MADMVQWRKRRRRIRRGEGMRSRIRVLGNKHPDVATTYNNMGSVYHLSDQGLDFRSHLVPLSDTLGHLKDRSMGDLDKALEMADKVLSIAPELFQS